MRESRFIYQNREKWKRFEEGISSGSMPAEEMESAFVELNDDLAYARTFYKNRAVRLFLNNLLAPVYTAIYKGKRWSWKSLGTFFLYEAQRMNNSERYLMMDAFITELLGICIGFFATRFNSDFAVAILGADYVQFTEYNISKGDPLAIYKYQDAGDMFVSIALNNLRVAAFFFVFGALFCVGTMYLLLYNGIILGAFTWLFTSKGLTTEYLLTVYQHGTLEILGMVVEGAAGLMIGMGILFPGTVSRARSMQIAAKKSVVIFLVCVPVIMVAAFIESYLTRFTEIHNLLRLAIILMSLAFMLYYFVVFPIWKFRKASAGDNKGYDKLEPDSSTAPTPGEIYQNNTLVLYAFDFIKRNAMGILLIGLGSVACMFLFVEFLSNGAITQDIQYKLNAWVLARDMPGVLDSRETAVVQLRIFFFNIYASAYYFSNRISFVVSVFSWMAICGIVFYVLNMNRRFMERSTLHQVSITRISVAAILCATFQVLLHYFLGNMWPLGILVLFPLQVFFALQYCLGPSYNPIETGVNSLKMLAAGIGKIAGAMCIVAVLYFVIMFGIFYLITEAIEMTQQFHGGGLNLPILKFFVALNYFLLPLFLVFGTYFYTTVFLSLYEVQTGVHLRQKIEAISFKREIFGMETE